MTCPRQTNSNHSRLGQLGRDTGHPKIKVLMFLDTTVGNILRKSHKPAKAHRIPQNIQTFIMNVMNAEFTNTRNSVSRVSLGKENSNF